jgi:hypothetical protein
MPIHPPSLGDIKVLSGSESLDDTRATPCPKMTPSEVVNPYEFTSTGLIVESGPLTGKYHSPEGKV